MEIVFKDEIPGYCDACAFEGEPNGICNGDNPTHRRGTPEFKARMKREKKSKS